MAHDIRILPEETVNKIAAGEVIERPASVIKELVENALDAEATEIKVAVQDGGRRSIEVIDNGEGMSLEGITLALERHATSKIRSIEDLFIVKTYGFRGEALPSIASVSKLEIFSKEDRSLTGTYLRVEGGRIEEVREVGCPKGTRVKVQELFFNVPARKKFMRSHATESSHIYEMVIKMAMANPEVSFKYVHGNRIVLDSLSATSWKDRLVDIFGKEISSQLYAVNMIQGAYKVRGFLSHPNLSRATTSGIYIFVNGRSVQDNLIRRVLLDGYRPFLLNKRFPYALLFLSVPFGEVDVNVHPSKREIRFREPGIIRNLILKTVELLIHERPWLKVVPPISRGERDDLELSLREPISGFKGVKESMSSSLWRSEQTPLPLRVARGPFSSLQYIGQLSETYLLFSSSNGLVLIDQHAAHERILFEKIQKGQLSKEGVQQQYLLDIVFDLLHTDSERLSEVQADLVAAGIDIESFGVNTWRIRAIPLWMVGIDVKGMILELLEELASLDQSEALEKKRNKIASILSCHGAIKAHRTLEAEEVHTLIKDLDQTRSSTHCPHGRPTIVEIPFDEIERRFRRR